MRTSTVDTLLAAPPFAGLDAAFADLMVRLAGEASPELRLAAALVSRRRDEGHVCLDLDALEGTTLSNDTGFQLAPPPIEPWIERLRRAPAVLGGPGDARPLILDGRRLYLRRYWDYEQRLAGALLQRAGDPIPIGDTPPAPELREILDALFPPRRGAGPDLQRLASLLALRHRLTVILGGPGTGKTRTVVRALSLLLATGTPLPRIAITAPTGKAVARLQETIRNASAEAAAGTHAIPLAALAAEAQTLHRLLKILPGTGHARMHAANPLSADVVVVDEASMVDLALMSKLLAALQPTARLILLGDRNQLAAVEAGSVLADLAAGATGTGWPREIAAAFETTGGGPLPILNTPASALDGCCVELRENHRFGRHSAIHRASEAIHRGDAVAALQALRPGDDREASAPGHACHRTLPYREALTEALRPIVLDGFDTAIGQGGPAAALAAADRFRILAAVRMGPYGVAAMNALAEGILRDAGRIGPGSWYAGRPILVTTNDPELALFNGDLGVVLPGADGRPGAWFSGPSGIPRCVAPSRLPPHETAHALTIHKSQGSEFESVLIVLPDRDAPILTRELVYTALTRARHRAELWAPESLLQKAIARRTHRASGLRDRLRKA
ncbi:MAG: exodeoxyribonuclease V subunit alpha [Verrucomicrobiae bacterium]|nr:exodeoxyribonuclease V subunit alpha [Verrucomicrobiae bacterium]